MEQKKVMSRRSSGIASIVIVAVALTLVISQVGYKPVEEVVIVDIDPASVADGTYQGIGRGIGDDIVVEVTVSNGMITNIVIVSHGDTQNIFEKPEAELPGRIIDAQSIDVDAVSGATVSSQGILEAVFDALELKE